MGEGDEVSHLRLRIRRVCHARNKATRGPRCPNLTLLPILFYSLYVLTPHPLFPCPSLPFPYALARFVCAYEMKLNAFDLFIYFYCSLLCEHRGVALGWHILK